jgi:hypothetical protein
LFLCLFLFFFFFFFRCGDDDDDGDDDCDGLLLLLLPLVRLPRSAAKARPFFSTAAFAMIVQCRLRPRRR